MQPLLRAAHVADLPRLCELAFTAKASWGYPREWLELWRADLRYDERTLREQCVIVAELECRVRGVCSFSCRGEDAELEGLWIDPALTRRGLGRSLLNEAVRRATLCGAVRMHVVAEPRAEAFYLRLGAHRVGTVPSRPAGRVLPELLLTLARPSGAG
jgi:N-acetylglutamate synthase-like GNAT family acetyltransferase